MNLFNLLAAIDINSNPNTHGHSVNGSQRVNRNEATRKYHVGNTKYLLCEQTSLKISDVLAVDRPEASRCVLTQYQEGKT